MSSPGRWRWLGVLLVLGVALLPAVPLFWQTLGSSNSLSPGTGFTSALANSLRVAFFVGIISFLVGLPLGAGAALFAIPARGMLLAVLTLPLLVPSFLWAIGWSSLTASFGPYGAASFEGIAGC